MNAEVIARAKCGIWMRN